MCSVDFPDTGDFFYKRHSVCKDCSKKRANLYYKNNKNIILIKVKEYRENNKEKISEYHKEYYSENKEEIDKVNKQWQKNNQDKHRISSHKSKALKLGNIHEDWTEQEMLETYGTDCYLCNQPIDFDAPRKGPGSDYSCWPDHVVPIKKGGENTIRNIRPCHSICNRSKSDKTYEEYILTVNSQEIVTQPL